MYLAGSVPFFCGRRNLPKADTILDHYVEVVGGKAVPRKHRSEVMHGTIEVLGRA